MKKIAVNKNRLSLLGWLTAIYSGIFTILGLFSSYMLFILFYVNIFKSIFHGIIYVITWLIIYLLPVSTLFKTIVFGKNNRHKYLIASTILWFLGSFSLMPLIMMSKDGLGSGIVIATYAMIICPHIYLIDLGGLGLVLFLVPPIFDLYLVCVAWKRPQWFYKE
ncbi:hypothetical protein [Maridesulfovibrio sp.]|uniref:hypothetical protein n=1 Tax=Maridesulfovibrio sp. TaxID=2795000 RepID=UPI002A18D4EE|nr:hypothetical protein [Maridesulfovibrio sp.]